MFNFHKNEEANKDVRAESQITKSLISGVEPSQKRRNDFVLVIVEENQATEFSAKLYYQYLIYDIISVFIL